VFFQENHVKIHFSLCQIKIHVFLLKFKPLYKFNSCLIVDLMTTKKKKRIGVFEDSEEPNELQNEDIYNDEQREEMLKEDEITAAENGFMQGREMTSKTAKRLKKFSHKDSVSVELAEEEYSDD